MKHVFYSIEKGKIRDCQLTAYYSTRETVDVTLPKGCIVRIGKKRYFSRLQVKLDLERILEDGCPEFPPLREHITISQ